MRRIKVRGSDSFGFHMKVVNTTHMTAHQNETNTSDIWQCVSLLMYPTTKYNLKLNEVLLTFTEVLVYISVLVIFYKKIYGGECSNFWYISPKPSKWLQNNENVKRGKKL